jgi:hypothetical protein
MPMMTNKGATMKVKGKVLGEYSITTQGVPIDISNRESKFSAARTKITLEFEPNGIEIKKGERLCFNGKVFTVTHFKAGRIEGLTD